MSARVGDRVVSIADPDLQGRVVSAPAPQMRRIEWDDGDSGDVDVRDVEVIPG